VIADARERRDGSIGQPVEEVSGIAEGLRQPAAGGEVQVAGCLVRDVAVHGSDLAIEHREVHTCGSGICGVRVHDGSFAGTPSRNLP